MKTSNSLLERVKNSLSNEPVLKNCQTNIHVLIHDRTVILSGSVENLQLKNLITKIVSETPGVNRLIENIRIEPPHDRIDVEIDWTSGKLALSY